MTGMAYSTVRRLRRGVEEAAELPGPAILADRYHGGGHWSQVGPHGDSADMSDTPYTWW